MSGPTHVQTVSDYQSVFSGSPHNTPVQNFPVTLTGVVTGNTLAGSVMWNTSGGTVSISSVTVSGNSNATVVDSLQDTSGSFFTLADFYLENVTGGNLTVTVNFSAVPGGFETLAVSEISGLATSGSLHKHAINDQTSPGTATDALTSGSQTTTFNGCYVYGMGYNGRITSNPSCPDAGTGFTSRASQTSNAQCYDFRLEDQVQSSAGSIAATFTAITGTGAQAHITAMMVFKPLAGGLFRDSNLSGLQSGGSLFVNPLG